MCPALHHIICRVRPVANDERQAVRDRCGFELERSAGSRENAGQSAAQPANQLICYNQAAVASGSRVMQLKNGCASGIGDIQAARDSHAVATSIPSIAYLQTTNDNLPAAPNLNDISTGTAIPNKNSIC